MRPLIDATMKRRDRLSVGLVDLRPRPPHHPGMDRRRFLLTSLVDTLGGSVAAEAQPVPKVVAPGFDAAVYRGQDAQGDVPVGAALAFVLTKGLPIHGLMFPVETYSGIPADLARGCRRSTHTR
jgi:hypothetical protein